ncbi:MAG: type II toxin-antitoxin system VapB family antitoxin [Planctomycetes bacterium]|nr:type II toxin-antitoxin system VapB family antitoxin [Planctomycetota bacterium]
MLTNLGADPKLVEEARQLGGHATKTAAIRAALVEYVQLKKSVPVVGAPASGTARRRKNR